ncbi:MAG: hypothetical protein WBL61_21610 [Bryobacteraceae bacterium]
MSELGGQGVLHADVPLGVDLVGALAGIGGQVGQLAETVPKGLVCLPRRLPNPG